MRSKHVFIFLLTLLFGFASAQEPVAFLKSKMNPMIEAVSQSSKQSKSLDALVDQLGKMVYPIIDERGLAQQVTGKYWKTATPQQQDEFTKLFVRLVIRSFIAYVAIGQDIQIKFRPVSNPGDTVLVNSQVSFASGDKWKVDYLLKKDGEGWLVSDIIVDGLSLVTSYREQFKSILKQSGFSGLIKSVKRVAG